MKGIVVDASCPSKAFLEGYPNSNCEQYQELLDQVPQAKRAAFIAKVKTRYEALLEKRKEQYKKSVVELNEEIDKFIKNDGVIEQNKKGLYIFNGFLTSRDEPFFYDRLAYSTQIENLQNNKARFVAELEELDKKASKHLFKKHYKKEERESLRKTIFNYERRLSEALEEQSVAKTKFEDDTNKFTKARMLLVALEKVTFYANSINKAKRLLDYIATTKPVSAKKFAEEYKERAIYVDKKLEHNDIISLIVLKNKEYRTNLSTQFMSANRDEVVNIDIELPKTRTKVQTEEYTK